MTDLIQRDAAIAECQKVADEAKSYGILQMTMGANTCRDAIRAIPAIDPTEIREAALREAADSVRGMADFCKTMGDIAGATALYSAATSLIGEKTAPELKPCPFCGGEAVGNISAKEPYIYCEKCDVCGPGYHTVDEALAAWNRRAIPAIDPAAIREAALIEAADELRGHGYNTAVRAILALIGEKK